jgi:2-polyprenyl-3-methyl-5-hydroxy-6-metoxy-1,4-benzoquinol methylase
MKTDVLIHRLKGVLRIARARFGTLRPGSAAYERQIEMESKHYVKVYSRDSDGRLMEPAPAAWNQLLDNTSGRIADKTGKAPDEHIVEMLRGQAGAAMLSLGCGAGGLELYYAREAREATVTGLDINPETLKLGAGKAADEGLAVTFGQADLNTATLPEAAYDVVLCHASLHHLLRLEHVFDQVWRTLRPGGRLVVIDVMARNGYLLWPKTRKIANELFRTLPRQFQLNHTGYRDARYDGKIWAPDTRAEGMECLRSAEIVPMLRARFREESFVGSHAFCRRFFDTMYGPNYDLSRRLDRAIFDWLWELDCHYIDSGQLEPETFFGVYSRD